MEVESDLRTVVTLSGCTLPALDGQTQPESEEAEDSQDLHGVSRQS